MEMDKEIDNLATRTAELFDNVKTGASSSLASAKSRNTKLRDDIKKSREEKLLTTTDPHERAILERQEMCVFQINYLLCNTKNSTCGSSKVTEFMS